MEIIKTHISHFPHGCRPPIDFFDICLYHDGCSDGIGAAYPFWKINRDKNLLRGVKHNVPYPADLIRNKKVLMVDFCYSREIIKELCELCNYILVLDHHKTSLDALDGLENDYLNLAYIFDLDRSGAQIAYDYYVIASERPWFIDVIADRDLWKWDRPHSKEIGAALYYKGWYTWEKMLEFENSKCPERDQRKLLKMGKIILDIQQRDIEHVARTSFECKFQNYRVRIATCDPRLRSEVGNMLAERYDCDFAVVWRYSLTDDQWWINFRGSRKCNILLNKLCEQYGGGGHTKASGFTIHGDHSRAWQKASFTERESMAHGNLWDYFILEK